MSQIFRHVIFHCAKANQRATAHRSLAHYSRIRIAAQRSSQCGIKSCFSTVPEESEVRFTNEQRYETEMPIEKNQAGRLIGQSGAQIRQLMQMTGCGIHIAQLADEQDESRVVKISSEVESRLAYAKLLISELINHQSDSLALGGFNTDTEYRLECEIPASKLGLLVGKGGDNINRLRGLNNCNISTEREQEAALRRATSARGLGSAKVKVTFSSGNVINCFKARDAALAYLNLTRESLECDEHVVNVPIPGRFAGEIIGKGGATVRLLKQLSKCEIRLSGDNRDRATTEIVIMGVERDCEDTKDIVTALANIHKRHNPSTRLDVGEAERPGQRTIPGPRRPLGEPESPGADGKDGARGPRKWLEKEWWPVEVEEEEEEEEEEWWLEDGKIVKKPTGYTGY